MQAVLAAVKEKQKGCINVLTSTMQDGQELLNRLKSEITAAETAAEQQSSTYAHFLFQDIALQTGTFVVDSSPHFSQVWRNK